MFQGLDSKTKTMFMKVLHSGISIKTGVIILVIIVTVYILTMGIHSNVPQHQLITQPLHTRARTSFLSQVMTQPLYNTTNATVSSALQVNVDNCGSDQGFLLTLYYEQQTTAAFIAYIQLAKIAGLLNLSSVEPFVHETSLVGGASYTNRQALKMSSLYNVTNMKNAINTCANTKLKSFEDFVNNASQHFVLVFFLTSVNLQQQRFLNGSNIVVFDGFRQDVHTYISPVLQTLNSWSHSYDNTSRKFNCSKVVFLDAHKKHRLPLNEIVDVLGSTVREQVTMFGSATVVLKSWRGIHSVPDSSFFSYVPGFTMNGCSDTHTIEHSQLVISAADHFVKHFNLTEPAVGVHIRGERLLRDSNWNIEYAVDCLQQLHNFLHNRSVDNNSFPENVYVFHDLGQYGSVSCSYNQNCVNGQYILLAKIKQLRLRVVEYDPSIFKSFPNSKAFASFVEREYLSHVQVLVTVGRGGFQLSIVRRYSKGNEKHVNTICPSPQSVSPS